MDFQIRDNLTINTLTKNNADEMFAVIDKNRNYLREWLPWVDASVNVERIIKAVEDWQDNLKNGTDIVMGIFLDGTYIGNIGLHDMKKPNNSAMIGYWLAENCQKKGIMTDCVRFLTEYGFNELNLNRIYIHCAEKNKKSRAIPQRLNYTQEGTLQDGEHLYGVYHNLVIYGTTKMIWNNNTTPDIIIRSATMDDADRVMELLEQIAEFHHKGRPDIFKGKDDGGAKKYTYDDFKEILTDEKKPVYVAVDKGNQNKIAGYVFCELTEKVNHPVIHNHKSLYIDDLCIDEDCRKQGVGRLLVEKCKSYAKANGCYNIDLNVWEFKDSAVNFYEKCGFKMKRHTMEFIIE